MQINQFLKEDSVFGVDCFQLTWKNSAMVATWLAQAHFLASGTSSPTLQTSAGEFKRGNRNRNEVCNCDFLLRRHPRSGVPSFRDPVIRSHSARAQCSVVGIDYRQNQGQETCHSHMGSVTRAARGDKERTAACWKARKKLWSFYCCQRFNWSLHQQIHSCPH